MVLPRLEDGHGPRHRVLDPALKPEQRKPHHRGSPHPEGERQSSRGDEQHLADLVGDHETPAYPALPVEHLGPDGQGQFSILEAQEARQFLSGRIPDQPVVNKGMEEVARQDATPFLSGSITGRLRRLAIN